MKRFGKSILSFVLVIAVTAGTLPITALANVGSWDESVNTQFNQNTSSNQWEEIERNTEVILRNPNLYEEIDGSDLKGAEVSHDETSRTFLLEDGTYLTRYYDEPIMYENKDGKLIDIDNTLISGKGGYTNSENAYDLTLSKKGEGIKIENKGYTLQLKPQFGNLTNAVVKENAIRYNNVSDGIDLQYTANGSSVKEDIIINKPISQTDFTYEIVCKGLTLEIQDNVLYAYENKNEEPIFTIAAPYMTDNAGEVSCAVGVSLQENLLVVQFDKEWMQDESRAYPVVIDPVIQLNQSNLEYGFVENGNGGVTYNGQYYSSGPNSVHSQNAYLYVGFERGNLTGIPGLVYGQTASYLKINYDFSQIPDYAIIKAYLKGYKYAGSPSAGTKIYAAMITSDWKGARKTWNTRPEYSLFGQGSDVSAGDQWVTWDITYAVQQWRNNPASNKGIMLVPANEGQNAVCFSGPSNSHGRQAMYFDVSWTVENPVDENLPLNAPNIKLRTLTQTHSSGLQTLNGVFADGIVRPMLDVSYRLNDVDSGTYKEANYGKIYPNSDEFKDEINFTLGYVQMFQSNWQSKLFRNFEYNKLYNVYATATNGTETTPEGKSDSFIVYKFSEQDTIPYVANFYGVTVEQLIEDNKPRDYLAFPNNTFFIRNPQQNATIAYTRPDNLTDEQKRDIIYANLGRGMHSEFDLEPVNVNIGNYYFESTDAVSSEYNGTFTLSRSYNSIGRKTSGVFGNGWSFAYDEKLSGRVDGGMTYTMGDGKQIVFEKDGDGYKSPNGYYLTLEKHTGEKASDTYYTITEVDGTVSRFDCYGLLVSVTDRNGFATTVQYDASYNIKGIRTASGRQYTFSTSADGHITSVTLPNGGVLKYEYKDGNLVTFTNADQDIVRYVYNQNGQMTEWYDGNGNKVIQNEYDKQGRITKQTDALGNVSKLAYSEGKTVVTNPDDSKVTYYYDDTYRTTKVEGGDTDKGAAYDSNNQLKTYTENGSTVTYEYDENGNITKKTRADGTYQEITYDAYGNALTVRDYDGTVTKNTYDEKGNLLKVEKPNGSTISYTYDAYGQVTSLTDENGNVTTFVYDGLEKMTMTDANGNQTICYYDSMGQLVNEVDALGNESKTMYSKQGKKIGTWKTGDIYEQYLYDGNGNCVEVIDAEGYKTTFTYDANNQMKTATNPLDGTITYTYDKAGNKVSETDTLGNVTKYRYNDKGQLIETTDAAGKKVTYTYHENGQVSTIKNADGSKVKYEYDDILGLPVKMTDKTGTVTYTYDSMGRTLKVIYPDDSIIKYTYDSVGNILTVTSQNGLVTNYVYDKVGNLLEQSDTAGGKQTYTYDAVGNLKSITDALGNQTVYTYDKANRNLSQTNAKGGVTEYAYDNAGNIIAIKNAAGVSVNYTYDKCGRMTSMKDGNGNITEYKYNGTGDLIAEIDAMSGTTTYAYDKAQNLISYTDAVSKTTTFAYDSLGQVVSTTDADGYETKTEYDQSGNVVEITSANGSKTSYTYDEKGYLVKAKTADGLVTEYEYDVMGHVTREWDNAGNETVSTYDISGNLLTQTDAADRVAEYTYDLYGNVTRIKDFNGDITTYEYDLLSQLVAETDAKGRKTTYTYDALGNLIATVDADGVTYHYEYDAVSQLTKSINPLNEVTAYSYDNGGNLIAETDAAGNQTTYAYSKVNNLIAVTDGNGNTQKYEYDAVGQVVKHISAEGSITEYAYDGRGNVAQVKNPLGYVTKYEYNFNSNLIQTTSPRGAVTKYTYNNAGLQLSVTDAKGNTTENKYDLDGKLLSETLANGLTYAYKYDKLGRVIGISDNTGYETVLTYDKKGNVSSQTDQDGNKACYNYNDLNQLVSVVDASGAKTEYSYDERGNLTSVTSPAGGKTVYSYDILDRMTVVEQPLTAALSYTYDAVGQLTVLTQGEKTITTGYDAVGNTVSVTNPLGDVQSYIYDKDNRLVSAKDYLGNITKAKYDGAGNVVSITDALGNKVSYNYDGDGNNTKITDALGNATEYRYDKVGNLTGVKSASGHVTEYTYDALGNPLKKTAADGSETEYTYDLHGNMTAVTSPDGTVEQFIYDVSSRLVEATKPDGRTIEYDYDSLNNLLSKTYSDDSESVSYGYDTYGNRITMEDELGKTSYTYDVLGRVTSVTDASDRTIEYTYDKYGRISEITYPEERKVTYTYDLADNLLKVEDSAGDTTEYTYDKQGNVLTCIRSSGIITEYAYDALGQVVSVINKTEEEQLSSFVYTYDGNGQIIKEEAMQGEDISEKTFEYDEEGQLIGYIEELNGEVTKTKYNYSVTGSRVAITTGEDKNRIVSEYNENGQLVKETNEKTGTTKYAYDENGNLIEKENEDELITYTYDVENRLTAVREGGALLMAATYDGDGNRTFQLNRQVIPFSIERSEQDDSQDSETGDSVGGTEDSETTLNPQNDSSSLPDTTGVKQDEVYTYYEKVYADPADSIFWYGFGQGTLQFFANINTSLGAYLSDWLCQAWNAITSEYELVLHSDAVYSEEDIEAMKNAGLSDEEIIEITGCELDKNGEFMLECGNSKSQEALNVSSDKKEASKPKEEVIVIPSKPDEVTRIDYDLTYYVNDINTANTQVLMTYGRNQTEKAVYVYGEERIAEDDLQVDETSDYLYDGRGSVVQTTIEAEIDMSLTYDPFGEITSGADENFVGYAYNGEESNEVTGLQYLRARYYDTELGSFITIDTYLGSLDNAISQNRYTYANNDPVNHIDSTGHYSVNVNGTSQYYQTTGLNELRDYMTAAALWAGQVTAQSSFNGSVARASNTSFMNYQSITGISQSTANSYINQGIAQAGQVSMNYGCSVPTVPNQAVAKFSNNVNAAKNSANARISSIKAQKKVQYDAYQEEQRRLEEAKKDIYPYLIYKALLEHGNENSYGKKSKKTLLEMLTITKLDLRKSEEKHLENLIALVEKFSKGKLQKVALDMVNRFASGDETDRDYSNEILTNAVKKHKNTVKYYEAVSEAVTSILSKNGGNIESLYYDETIRADLPLINAMLKGEAATLPSYGGDLLDKDTTSGLTICVHGWNANEITITSYESDGESFAGTLHFKFIDTFGLDEKDIDEPKNLPLGVKIPYGVMQGFRSWYILQHYEAYDGRYKPLNTIVEFDVNFSGEIK